MQDQKYTLDTVKIAIINGIRKAKNNSELKSNDYVSGRINAYVDILSSIGISNEDINKIINML